MFSVPKITLWYEFNLINLLSIIMIIILFLVHSDTLKELRYPK